MFEIRGKEKLEKLLSAGSIYKQASRSAMRKVGFEARKEVVDHIRSQGRGRWKSPSLITSKFKSDYNQDAGDKDDSRWKRRRKAPKVGLWATRFIRYRVSRDGMLVEVTMDTSMRGQPGAPIPEFFKDFLNRFQERYRQPVLKRMRGFFGAMRKGRKRPQIGQTFFPISKARKYIENPKRDIFDSAAAAFYSRLGRVYGQQLSKKLNELLR